MLATVVVDVAEGREKMPTGYISKLKDNNFNLKQWLKECCPRAFGVCATLRDENFNLSEDEIIKKLRGKSSYYQTEKGEIVKEIQRLQDEDNEKLKEEFFKKQSQSQVDREKKIQEVKDEEAKFLDAKNKILQLKPKADGEIIPNILDFAIEQVNSHLKFDCSYSCYLKPNKIETQTFGEYLISEDIRLREKLTYYAKENLEDEERNNRRVDSYLSLVNFIDDNADVLT